MHQILCVRIRLGKQTHHLARYPHDPSDSFDQCPIGALDLALLAFFPAGSIAADKTVKLLDPADVKAVSQVQTGMLLPDTPQITYKDMVAVPQKKGIGRIMDVGLINCCVSAKLISADLPL